MNKIIKSFIDKATYVHTSHSGAEYETFDHYQFAELILLEAELQLYQMLGQTTEAKNIAEQVRTHLGVPR